MKKAKYRQLVDKYKKEIESLREDILALVGDDCMLKYQTHKRWEMILSMGDSMMFGSRSISEQGQGIFDIPNLNPALANEHTPIDVNFGGKHAPTIGSSATKIVSPNKEEMAKSVETLGRA